jgi:hypothetical protein
MGFCSSSTCLTSVPPPYNNEPNGRSQTYQQTTGDHDHDAALRVRRLSIEGRDLVLHLLEGKRLLQDQPSAPSRITQTTKTNRQLLGNGGDTLDRGGFEGKHRVVTL